MMPKCNIYLEGLIDATWRRCGFWRLDAAKAQNDQKPMSEFESFFLSRQKERDLSGRAFGMILQIVRFSHIFEHLGRFQHQGPAPQG